VDPVLGRPMSKLLGRKEQAHVGQPFQGRMSELPVTKCRPESGTYDFSRHASGVARLRVVHRRMAPGQAADGVMLPSPECAYKRRRRLRIPRRSALVPAGRGSQ
jgi:hypothetical protein